MIGIILLLIPIIIGAVVALAKPKPVVSWTNKLNDWISEKKKKFAEKDDAVSNKTWSIYKSVAIKILVYLGYLR